MVEDVILRVMRILDQHYSVDIGMPYFGKTKYVPTEFNAKNFHEIPDTKLENCNLRVIGVDGGNHEIISTPSLSISLIRLSAIALRGKKREKLQFPCRVEAFCLAKLKVDDDKIKFGVEFFPLSASAQFLKDCRVEEKCFEGVERALDFNLRPLSVVAGIARKHAEWLYIEKLIEKLDDGDVVLRDGVFQYGDEHEAERAKKVCQKAREKGITLTGLAKTTTLITNTGVPLPLALQTLAEHHEIKSPWYYYPLTANLVTELLDENNVDIYIAKFNENTEYIFRFEVMVDTVKQPVETILGILRAMSANCIFPGYPYILILADKMARVEERECKSLYYRFISFASDNRRIQRAMKMLDAHDLISKY